MFDGGFVFTVKEIKIIKHISQRQYTESMLFTLQLVETKVKPLFASLLDHHKLTKALSHFFDTIRHRLFPQLVTRLHPYCHIHVIGEHQVEVD